jgi:hypothetical protein
VVEHACRQRARRKAAACWRQDARELLDSQLLATTLRVLLLLPAGRGQVRCCTIAGKRAC